VRVVGAVGIALVAAHCQGPRGLRHAAARQSDADVIPLASGQADIGAGSPVAWRVVKDVAEVGLNAGAEERALGFVVPSGPFGSLMLTDNGTGERVELTPIDAAFVADGTIQRRESLGSSPQAYLRLELVYAGVADDAGDDRLLFTGAPFDAPDGPARLALARVALAAGGSVGLPPGAGETLILVEQGEAELEVGEGAQRDILQTVVGSDTSYAIRTVASAAMLYGARAGTSVLIATIG
jgi:hypothetical protein